MTPIADIAALASSEHGEESVLSPQKMTAALAKELMIRQNEEFVENKQCQDVYREVLEIHLAEEGQSSNIAVEGKIALVMASLSFNYYWASVKQM